jgi:hypothetical protein
VTSPRLAAPLRRAAPAAVLLVVLLLAGCSASVDAPDPADTVAPTATAEPAPTETAQAEDLAFTMPAQCLDIFPESRQDAFAAAGDALLGGPGGTFGTDYLADPTPEEQAGGISCIWGSAESEISSFTVSVAPLTLEARPGIVQSLVDQGLNEGVVDDATTFGVEGDRRLDPAVVNELRADSWISVIATEGGSASYAESLEIAAEVHDAVYSAR